MTAQNYKYSELTSIIIGCAMRVHSALGSGFPEVIYQRALEAEFIEKGILFKREFEMPVYYKDKQVGTRRVDFLVKDVIPVELKAIAQIENLQLAHTINYLEAFDLEIGLLINFGAKSLEFKRLINKNHRFVGLK